MLRVHVDESADAELSSTLDELVAEGARRMLAAALEAEVDGYILSLIHEVDEEGHRLVVRNGHAQPRSLVTEEQDRDRGPGPTSGRPPGRRSDRREGAVSLIHPAAVGPQVPQGGRGTAADVSART